VKSCGTLEARAAESWQRAPPCTLPAPRCSRKSLAPPGFNIRAHRVAIWDTIVACERAGSLDAAIRGAERGGIHQVRRIARELRAVCFNGNTAGRARGAWAEAGYETLVLPSTSPAYTRPFAEKLAAWRELRRFLEER